MRIAVVGPTYPFRGGIAYHTTLMVKHLRKMGHEVLFLSFTRQYPKLLFPGKDDRDPTDDAPRTEVEYTLDSINPLTWRTTAKRIVKFQPEILILPWWHPYWTLPWLFLVQKVKRTGTSRVHILCHNVLPHEENVIDKFATKLVLGKADLIIVQAESEQAKLNAVSKVLIPKSIVLNHPTYGDLDPQLDVRLPVKLPNDKPILLFAGIVRRYKGLDILLDAMPSVLQKIDLHLAIVGEFWDEESLYQEQIDANDIRDSVTVINRYVSNAILVKYIKSADVVVLPYRRATQSGVVQLASGLGTPVIVSDVGGLKEVVEKGNLGLVTSPENPQELANAILSFLASPESFQPHRSRQTFSWEEFCKKIVFREKA